MNYKIAIQFFILVTVISNGCKKDSDSNSNSTPVCDIRGIYTGTRTTSTGNVASMTYNFQENNFATSSVTPTSSTVTFGGYRNTCDSVFISVYYTANSSYYLLKGALTNNRTTLSGTYNNLTTPSDYGTFSISR